MLIDLITFAGLTILYFAYDLYVSRLQPAFSRDRTAEQEQRAPVVVLRFRKAAFATGPTARRRAVVRVGGRTSVGAPSPRGGAERPSRDEVTSR
jgi:hypothetical protein